MSKTTDLSKFAYITWLSCKENDKHMRKKEFYILPRGSHVLVKAIYDQRSSDRPNLNTSDAKKMNAFWVKIAIPGAIIFG